MNAYEIGRAAGYIVAVVLFLVLPILGIVASFRAMGRKDTNAMCALAAALALGAWCVMVLLGIVAQSGKMPPLVAMPFGLAFLGLTVASIVVGIVGLVEWRRHPQRYEHGRKRAIGTLVASGLLLLVMVGGIVAGLAGHRPSFLPPLTGKPGQPIVNEAWNFRLEPPAPWAPFEAGRLNPLARAGLARQRPGLFFFVIAENLAGRGGLSLDGALETIKLQLRGNEGTEFLDERRASEHGLEGRRLESEGNVGAARVFYVHWITENNGVLYQLITWGAAADRAAVREESARLVSGFHLIDARRVSLPAAERAPPGFRSLGFGYQLELTGTVWTRRWPSLAEDAPFAEFGVLNPTGTASFVVIPVWTGDDTLDLDVLTTALVARISLPFPDPAFFGVKEWRQGRLNGRVLACERTVNEVEYLYRLRIVRGHGYAWLLATWMDKKTAAFADFLDEAMDRVQFADKQLETPLILSERERKTNALVWNDIGVELERRGNPAAAQPWMHRAVETWSNDPTIVANYVNTSAHTGKAGEALALLDKLREKFPGNQQLAAKRALLQMSTGDVEGSLASYGVLFDAGWRDAKEFGLYIDELCARNRTDTALTAIDRYAAGNETAAVRRLRVTVLQARGQHPEAIALLTALREAAPGDTALATTLADAYFAAQRYTETIAECAQLISANRATAYIHWRKGHAEFALKRYREAKASFELAYTKEPANTEVKRMLDHVSGMLGEGGNTLVKNPLEPVPIPDALLAAAPAEKADAYLRGFSAFYRHAVRAIALEKGRELKTTEQHLIQVLDQQGVEKFSTLEFHFDPLSEEIYVNDITVRDAEEKVVGSGRVEDSYVVDDGVGETATQRKILHAPVPALRPGHTLEYTVTRRETGRAETLDFRAHLFAKGLPVLRSALHVQAPRSSLRWEASPSLAEPKATDSATTWIVERPPVYRWEPLQAPIDTFLPMVWLGDAGASWPDEARKYLEQIADRLPVEPAVREAAQATTKNIAKPADKAAALARFVQRELTYKAIEFGRRARIPNTGGQILRNKYGDCKDHALLLAQLLESAGVPARLVLVNSGSAVREKLPSLDQFDHMIVFVPEGKGGAFVDCTGKSSDLRAAPPYGLATRQTLILDPERPRLATLPPIAAGSATLSCTRDVSFSTETDLEVRETVTFTGVTAAGMRASLQAVEPAHRQRHLLQFMNRSAPTLELREAEIAAIDDPQQPLVLKLRYLLRRKFQSSGGQLIGQWPAIWERIFLAGEAVEQRLTPFRIWAPLRVETRMAIALPAGWNPAPGEARKADGPYFRGAATTRLEQRTLRLEGTLTQNAGQFPAREYSAYLDASHAAVGCFEQNAVLRK